MPEKARLKGIKADTGHRVEPVPARDEQTFAERLVEEGMEDAEQDQMEQGTRQGQEDESET